MARGHQIASLTHASERCQILGSPLWQRRGEISGAVKSDDLLHEGMDVLEESFTAAVG